MLLQLFSKKQKRNTAQRFSFLSTETFLEFIEEPQWASSLHRLQEQIKMQFLKNLRIDAESFTSSNSTDGGKFVAISWGL